MKKLLVLLLALALVFAFAACGAAPAEDAEPEETAEETTEETTEEPAEETAADLDAILEITQSGWLVEDGYLFYYVVLHNNDDKNGVLYPSYYINARNSEGTLIGTEEQTLSVIYPGEDVYYGFQAFEVTEEPATVEFEVVKPDDYNIKKVTSEVKPLEIVSAVASGDNVVGEIKNDNDEDISGAAVVVVFKDADGNYTAADTTFTDTVPAHGTAPFSLYVYKDYQTDSFDVFAYQW